MNEEAINLIRNSWLEVATYPNAILKFYDKLFEISPDSKRFFPEDLSRQSEKLAYTIGFAVENLERLDEIQESIEDLGRMHNELDIAAEYYVHVKDALIFTIKEALADSYHDEIGEAWDVALTHIATVMINAPEKKKEKRKNLLQKLFAKL